MVSWSKHFEPAAAVESKVVAAQVGPEAAEQAAVQAAASTSFAFALPGVATPALRTWGTVQDAGN